MGSLKGKFWTPSYFLPPTVRWLVGGQLELQNIKPLWSSWSLSLGKWFPITPTPGIGGEEGNRVLTGVCGVTAWVDLGKLVVWEQLWLFLYHTLSHLSLGYFGSVKFILYLKMQTQTKPPDENRGYLLRICFGKGLSHCHLHLAFLWHWNRKVPGTQDDSVDGVNGNDEHNMHEDDESIDSIIILMMVVMNYLEWRWEWGWGWG